MVAAAIVGGAVVGGVASYAGAKKSSSTAAAASDAAVAEQRRQFDLTRADTAPYRQIGNQALNTLGSVYGYNSTPTPSVSTTPNGFQYMPDGSIQWAIPSPQPNQTPASPAITQANYENFFASPDYQFRKQQGMQGIENTFSATGGAKSGNALRALADYNSNLASGEFGNWWNKQAALAGIGQTAVNTSASAGSAASSNIGNALIAGGNARASGISDAYGGINSAIQGGLSNYLLYRQLGKTPYYGLPSG